MVVSLKETLVTWPPDELCSLNPHIVERIEEMLKIHRHSYVIATSTLHGKDEHAALIALQQKFFDTNLGILVAHNAQDCTDHMSTIAKVMCKTGKEVIQAQVRWVLSSQTSSEVIVQALEQLGLSQHQSNVLLDCFGSIAAVAASSAAQLQQSSVDSITCNNILDFFDQDKILV
ncbi:PREDICTED: uncharacterized protein LOC106805699 [Priapulus caudatus]|uniref:Uncharacterized protein LOC106805699 n=1 Tax=Priapulus caudatus TaxID=37621 RepID=A0ABM1DSG5_PRICU|nr:PREDICTED: uncharacterized protein LOC106805699 [Priapulus caudatus]